MKALLINPSNRTVEPITLPDQRGDWGEVHAHIAIAISNTPGTTQIRAKAITPYDKEGWQEIVYYKASRQTSVRDGFKINGKSIAGKAIVASGHSGDPENHRTGSARLSASELLSMIEWLDNGVHY